MNVPCRSVTSGVHRVLFTMLNPSSAFPCVLRGAAEEGSKYGTFPRLLGAASKLLNTSGRPLFSRMRTKGLSLVLQCTRGRPPAAGTGHTGFLAPSGSQTPTFSRVDFTNFLDHIRKGCRPIFAQFSCRETESGVSRA